MTLSTSQRSLPSGVVGLSHADRGPRQERREAAPSGTLLVGQAIKFKGQIEACQNLVVEGRVETSMMDCREIEIAETGTFKGQAEFDRADIRGNFEGDLTAREYLVVRATGRITGKVKFGELEIERGGQIVGEVQVFDEGAARRTHGDRYDDTDHVTGSNSPLGWNATS